MKIFVFSICQVSGDRIQIFSWHKYPDRSGRAALQYEHCVCSVVLKRALENMPVNKTLMQASQAEYINRFYYCQHNAAAEFSQFRIYF